MIITADGQLVGRAPHIRDVGPHAHEWRAVGTGPDGHAYSECSLCGARTFNGLVVARASRLDWLAGGEWDAEPERVVPAAPEEVTAAVVELNEAQRRPSPEHRAAMPSVAVVNDPFATQSRQFDERQDRNAADAVAARESQERAAAEYRGEKAGVEEKNEGEGLLAPDAEEEGDGGEDGGADANDQPAPRRRGRPRKNAE